jgi:hypothetical protein
LQSLIHSDSNTNYLSSDNKIHADNSLINLKEIKHVVPILNSQRRGGYAKKRYLVLLLLATQECEFDGKKLHNSENLYFSISGLSKISKNLSTLMHSEPIHYDRSKVAKKMYQQCRTDHYVDIKKESGADYVAITKIGQKITLKMIKKLLDSQQSQESVSEVRRPSDVDKPNNGSLAISMQNQKILLTYSEFRMRTDIEPLLKYREFVGRKNELDKLLDFLSKIDKKIMIITGENGVGKTRLVLEFVRQLQNKNKNEDKAGCWNAYFIHPNRDFSPAQFSGHTLLVLDDGAKYRDLEKLIDFVLNEESEGGLKLLITVSSLLMGSIKRRVIESNYNPEVMEIKESDIRDFLTANLEWIDENIAERIENLCENSYIYAIIYAEYWRERGASDDPYEILSWKKEKYLASVAEKTRSSREDIEYVIYLISFINPLEWQKDKEYLKRILSNQKYTALENLIQEVRINPYQWSLFLTEEDSRLYIKPDVLAGFLLLESLKNSVMDGVIKELIRYMPYRIASNVISSRDFDRDRDRKRAFISMLWKELNADNSQSLEYSYALMACINPYFASIAFPSYNSDLREALDLRETRIDRWIKSFEDIYALYPREGVRTSMSVAIGHVLFAFLQEGYLEEANNALEGLRYFYKRFSDLEHTRILCACLALMSNCYAQIGQLKHATNYLREIRQLYEKNPQELKHQMALGLSRICNGYTRSAVVRPKLLIKIKKEIRQLYEKHPDDKILLTLAGILVNAIGEASKLKQEKDLVDGIREVRQLYEKHPDKMEEYVGLASMTYHDYLKINHLEASDDLKDLVEMGKTYKQKYWVHSTQLNDSEADTTIQELFKAAINYNIHSFQGEPILVLDEDMKRPEYLEYDQEVDIVVGFPFIRHHMFLDVKITYRNTELKRFTLIICPFRIKKDTDYYTKLQQLINKSGDPVLHDKFNDIDIRLTDRKGMSFLANEMLNLNERHYQLFRNNCMLIRIPLRSPIFLMLEHLMIGMGRLKLDPPSAELRQYCQFCKDYD